MPYSSAAVCGYLIKAMFGSSKTADFPATYYVALFYGDPEGAGVEPDSTGGYARVAVTNNDTNFSRSSDSVSNLLAWTWPTSTAGYQAGRQTLDHWALYDNASAGTRWCSGRIRIGGVPSSITVDGASLTPKIDIAGWIWRQGA